MTKWMIRFFVLGVIVATSLALLFELEHKNLVSWSIPEGVYIWLWPSSLLLIGMGETAPDSKWFDLIWEVITIAINGLLYTIIGICVGAVNESRKVKQ